VPGWYVNGRGIGVQGKQLPVNQKSISAEKERGNSCRGFFCIRRGGGYHSFRKNFKKGFMAKESCTYSFYSIVGGKTATKPNPKKPFITQENVIFHAKNGKREKSAKMRVVLDPPPD